MYDTSNLVKTLRDREVRRVAVIGRAGAGKTTVARTLADGLCLPLVHLDPHAWDAGWRQVPATTFAERELAAVGSEAWVLDGGYLSSPGWPTRLARADVIVLVEAPLLVCLWRIVRRGLRPSRDRRPDLPVGCEDGLSLRFIGWTILWSRRTRSPRRDAADKVFRVRGW